MRVKKAFLSDQCKEIRGKQQNGKDQRSLQENQRYQGNISCKDGHNKRNCIDVTEAEEIKKKWQEHTEELKLKKVGKTTRPFRSDLNQIPYDYTEKVTN